MPDYRRGRAAIETAATRKEGGNRRSFVPEIRWRDDGEKKYVLVLTPIEDVGTFDLHEWIPVGKGEKANGETYTRFETFLSRKDPFIGEDYDDLADRLGAVPKTRCFGVAVELEPIIETVSGRKRPKGFTVKTREFTRKTDDGEVEATAPEIGLIIQSAALMWNPLSSLDDAQGPIGELPVEIIRRGKDTGTRYDMVPFMDMPVDLGPLLDNLDALSYIADDLDEIEGKLGNVSTELEAAQIVAEAIFDRRIAELADKDRYDELVAPIEELKLRFPGNAKPAAAKKAAPKVTATVAAEEPGEAPARSDRFAELRKQIEKKQAASA